MYFDAIYNQGKLEFVSPVHFVHNHFRVRVDVPEQEIMNLVDPEVESQYAMQWLSRLEAIKQEVLQIPEDSLPKMTEKQIERLKAFEMREDR